jgi:hypothetical protein
VAGVLVNHQIPAILDRKDTSRVVADSYSRRARAPREIVWKFVQRWVLVRTLLRTDLPSLSAKSLTIDGLWFTMCGIFAQGGGHEDWFFPA